MTRRTFGLLIGVGAVAVLAYPVWRLATPWNYVNIGDYTVRLNTLTGIAQIKIGNAWANSFENDNFAAGLTSAELKAVQIRNIAWGANGILCGQAVNRSEHPVKGRLAFMIVVRDSGEKRAMPDRSLRRTVDWAVGTTPFVLVTGMKTPDRKLSTLLTLETMYDNENVGSVGDTVAPPPRMPPVKRK